VTPDACDHRTNHDHHQPQGSQRHQNRRDAERGGQDQTHRSQDLEGSDGLDAAGTEVFDPSRTRRNGGDLLLRQNQLAAAADQVGNGKQSGNDPEREVHEVLLWGPHSCPGQLVEHQMPTTRSL
jgi:hypothetical protein